MGKRILIISSDNTGHGHKSITEAIREQLIKEQDVQIKIIDGFALGGRAGLQIGKFYGSLTRKAADLYKIVWDVSFKTHTATDEMVELLITDRLMRVLAEYKPDTIVSTHPSFNGSVLNIMQKHGIKIPFMAVVADPVSISPLWADPRADITVCPTEEAKEKCLQFGVPVERIEVTGFPIREKFCLQFLNNQRKSDYDFSKPLECLIMSGGEGSGNMTRIAKAILSNFNARVKIITGRNKAMKKSLDKNLLPLYPERVEIFGFCDNIQELMSSSDIAFTRGSPNTMLEAVLCNVPLVITGALPGQEEGNPYFAIDHNLGAVCSDFKRMKLVLEGLLADNAARLKAIRASQREYAKPHAAERVAALALSLEPVSGYEATIPSRKPRRRKISR